MNIPVVEVNIIDPHGNKAPFVLTFFGIDYQEFLIIPGGGNRVYEALARRGFHGYGSSPFFVRKRSYAHVGKRTHRPKDRVVRPDLDTPAWPARDDAEARGRVVPKKRRMSSMLRDSGAD